MHGGRVSWIMHGAVDEALTRIQRRAALIGRMAIVGVRWLLFVLFLGSIAFTIDGSIAGSVPLWLRILFAAVTAVPNILQMLDWVWGLGRDYDRVLGRLSSEIERRLRRRWERGLFEWYGAEELAKRRPIKPADMPYFSVSRRTRLRRKTRLASGIVLVLVVSALVAAQLSKRSSLHYFAVGQEFHVDGTFAITVRGDPFCRRNTELSTGRECDVSVVVHNISHYNADIGPGSFAPIQEADTADYGASLVSDGNYYDYAGGEFNNDLVSPESSTEAKLEFTVPAGVTPDELRISAPDQSGVSVVSFHDKRT